MNNFSDTAIKKIARCRLKSFTKRILNQITNVQLNQGHMKIECRLWIAILHISSTEN